MANFFDQYDKEPDSKPLVKSPSTSATKETAPKKGGNFFDDYDNAPTVPMSGAVGEKKPSGGVEVSVKREPIQRAAGIAGGAGMGGLMGLATPEIMSRAGKFLSRLPGTPGVIGYGLQLSGQAMRPLRAQAGFGGIVSGAASAAAGEAAEMTGHPELKVPAELATGPAYEALRTGVAGALRVAASAFTRNASPTQVAQRGATVFIDAAGLNEQKISDYTKNFVEQVIREGKQESPEALLKISDALRKDAQGMLDRAKGVADADYRQTIAAADDLVRMAEQEATAVMGVGAKETRRVGKLAERFKMRGAYADQLAEEKRDAAANVFRQIGEPRFADAVGSDLRGLIAGEKNALSESRSEAYKLAKDARDAAIQEKEAGNVFLSDTKEYSDLMAQLDREIQSKGATTVQNIADVRKAFQKIKDDMSGLRTQINQNQIEEYKAGGYRVIQETVKDKTGKDVVQYVAEKPISFQAIDQLRRKLGDVAAFDKEIEGYQALGADLAKQWYGKLSELQSKYVGPAQKELQSGYEAASRLLDPFKAGKGKKATALEDLGIDKFKAGGGQVAGAFFKDAEGVREAIALTGDETKVRQLLTSYVLKQIEGKTGKPLISAVEQNSALEAFPDLKQQFRDYALKRVEAEGFAKRAKQLTGEFEQKADAYRKEAKELPAKTAEEAQKVQRTAEMQRREARETAEKARTTAISDAEKSFAALLGEREGVGRIREMMQFPRREEWERIIPYLRNQPQARATTMEAVRQAYADLALKSPKTALQRWRDELAPILLRGGMVTAPEVEILTKQLERAEKPSGAVPYVRGVLRGVSGATGAELGDWLARNTRKEGRK